MPERFPAVLIEHGFNSGPFYIEVRDEAGRQQFDYEWVDANTVRVYRNPKSVVLSDHQRNRVLTWERS